MTNPVKEPPTERSFAQVSLDRFVSLSSFWKPEYLTSSGWLMHAPFAFWITEQCEPRKLVELGTHSGFSFFSFAQAVKAFGLGTACYAVDTWVGDDHSGTYGEDVFHRVYAHAERHYAGFSYLLRARFSDALSYFEDGSIDLLHIDGRHGYEDVVADFESWRPKLSERAIVLFHDTSVRERGFGVWKLWAELRQRYPSFEFVHGNGLGVLAYGSQIPARVRPLFEADDTTSRAVRAAYANLGDAVVSLEALERTRARVAELSQAEAECRHFRTELEARADAMLELQAREARLEERVRRHDEDLDLIRRAAARSAEDADRARAERDEFGADLVRARASLESCRRSLAWRVVSYASQATDKVPAPLRRSIAATKKLVARANPSGSKEREEDIVALLSSPYFDGEWYLATYPDVAEAGVRAVEHYLDYGASEGRDPSQRFSTRGYLENNPDVAASGGNALLHYVRYGASEQRRISTAVPSVTHRGKPLLDLVDESFPHLKPLQLFRLAGQGRRVTMVTDSINKSSLFGGVATAIVYAALLAKRLGASLRIVTLTERAQPENVGKMFGLHEIDWQANVEFAHVDSSHERADIDVFDDEIFVTTSWWSTWRTRMSVDPRRIHYILQEDERMFYAYGDEHLRCAETIADPDMRFVVNSQLLFDHLVEEGFDNIGRNGRWFEPAFPAGIYAPTAARADARSNFFFYARPNNHRNLYVRGLEVISDALLEGVLDPAEWRIHIVGKDLVDMSFPSGVEVKLVQGLGWDAYAALLSTMDLGLSLMYTPHPSYPPLDLAASGAVAVTNRFGIKRSLDRYSRNILCADVDRRALVDALRQGVALAKDAPLRRSNFEAQTLGRSWSTSFARVLDDVAPE